MVGFKWRREDKKVWWIFQSWTQYFFVYQRQIIFWRKSSTFSGQQDWKKVSWLFFTWNAWDVIAFFKYIEFRKSKCFRIKSSHNFICQAKLNIKCNKNKKFFINKGFIDIKRLKLFWLAFWSCSRKWKGPY